jgi:LDH2 family malate/lactate/ureidoglycolate dehydrogenase
MATVSLVQLRSFATDALKASGVSEPDAVTTAEVLATTDAWGVFTHGTKL